MSHGGRESGANTKIRERNGLCFIRSIQEGVFHTPDRRSEAEHNPLTKGASSATLNAQSTATALGRDPDMHCNVPTAPLLDPQPKMRDKISAAGEHHEKKMCMFYIYIYVPL